MNLIMLITFIAIGGAIGWTIGSYIGKRINARARRRLDEREAAWQALDAKYLPLIRNAQSDYEAFRLSHEMGREAEKIRKMK